MFPCRIAGLLILGVWLTPGVALAAEPLPERAVARVGRPGEKFLDNHTPIEVLSDGNFSAVRSATSPDGQLRASISDEHFVRLSRSDSGEEVQQLHGHTAYVAAVAFSADGKTLASGSNDRTLRLWDVAAGKALHVCTGHDDQVCAVRFSPDGKTVASASWDGSVRLWDVATGKERQCCKGHPYDTRTVAFAPDGKSLASGGADGRVRFWDAATGKELRNWLVEESGVLALVFTADGKEIVTVDGSHLVRSWDVRTGKELRRFPGPADSARLNSAYCGTFAPDSKTVALGHLDGTIRLHDAATGRALRIVGRHPGYIWSLAFAPDGKTLASSARRHGVVRLWDVATGQVKRSYVGHLGGVSRVLFSVDGKTLIAAGGSFEPVILVYDTASARVVHRLEGHTDYIEAIAEAPDGKILASVAHDSTLRLWDLATGKERQRYPAAASYHARVAFTPDGTGLIAADATGVCLRNVATGKEQRRFPLLTRFTGLSADGHALAGASNGSASVLLEARSGNERERFPGGAGGSNWTTFAPDGRRLLADAGDGSALVWDLTRGAKAGLTAREHDDLWRDLAGEAGRAYHAIWRLAQTPQESVSLLRERLRPTRAVDVAQIVRWVAELDDDDFAVREKATLDLEQAGEAAKPALEKALAASPSAEVKRRVEMLMTRLDAGAPPPEELRHLRALEVLEKAGTAEARKILEELAKGAPAAKLTREAKATVQRWPIR